MVVATTGIVVCYALLGGAEWISTGPRPRDLVDPQFLLSVLSSTSILVLLFGCSMYCSIFARRPLIAALGGALVGVGIAACVWLAWSLVAPSSPYLVGYFYAAGITVGAPTAALAVLAVGYRAFCRGDIFGPEPQRRLPASARSSPENCFCSSCMHPGT